MRRLELTLETGLRLSLLGSFDGFICCQKSLITTVAGCYRHKEVFIESGGGCKLLWYSLVIGLPKAWGERAYT